MQDYCELLIEYADEVVQEHVWYSYSQDLLEQDYLRFDHDLPQIVTTISLLSAIEIILDTFYMQSNESKAPKHIMIDLKEEVI